MRKLEKSELKRVYGAGGPGTHRHADDHGAPGATLAHNHGKGNDKLNGFTTTAAHSDGAH